MPIYDYRCDACGHVFSAVQSYQDESLEACPECAARPRRLMASPAIVFKGSGWYKTDSRAKPPAASGESKSSDGAPAAKPAGEGAAATPTKSQSSERSDRSDRGDRADRSSGRSDRPPDRSDSRSDRSSEARPAAPAKSDSAS